MSSVVLLHQLCRPFGNIIRRFRGDAGGSVAITFAIALVPLISFVGFAIDYSQANRIRTKLQNAADAAAVAEVSVNSAAYNAAVVMTSDGPVPAGISEAVAIFNGNANTMSGYNSLAASVSVTKTKSTLASSVQFTAYVPTSFLKVMGVQTLTVSSTSKADSSLPLHLDFYLMVDVSGSMGLASTANEQARLAAINPDNAAIYPNGCAFACHFQVQDVNCQNSREKYPTNNSCMGYPVSRVSYSGYQNLVQSNGGQLPSAMVPGLPNSLYTTLPPVTSCPTDGTDSCIQLRADAVGSAVNQLFATANSSTKVANQYRIGLYPFIQYLYPYFPLTSAINGSPTNPMTINYAAANLASLLDTNTNPNLGSGGTHIDTAFSSMNSTILSVGDGSSALSTQPYVFLITDGAQDNQIKGLNNGAWSGNNQATVINPTTVCGPLKARGIIVSVLYIPYQPITNAVASFANNEDGAANANIPNIPPSLQACASPGFFYTANSPTDITNSLNAMFNHAVTSAHLTN